MASPAAIVTSILNGPHESALMEGYFISLLHSFSACPNINIIAPEIAEDVPVSVKGVN